MTKFEQVSTDDHQMSLAAGIGYGQVERVGYVGGIPYHVTYPMMDGMLPTPPPWTDKVIFNENITFPQLLLRAVDIAFLHSLSVNGNGT